MQTFQQAADEENRCVRTEDAYIEDENLRKREVKRKLKTIQSSLEFLSAQGISSSFIHWESGSCEMGNAVDVNSSHFGEGKVLQKFYRRLKLQPSNILSHQRFQMLLKNFTRVSSGSRNLKNKVQRMLLQKLRATGKIRSLRRLPLKRISDGEIIIRNWPSGFPYDPWILTSKQCEEVLSLRESLEVSIPAPVNIVEHHEETELDEAFSVDMGSQSESESGQQSSEIQI